MEELELIFTTIERLRKLLIKADGEIDDVEQFDEWFRERGLDGEGVKVWIRHLMDEAGIEADEGDGIGGLALSCFIVGIKYGMGEADGI